MTGIAELALWSVAASLLLCMGHKPNVAVRAAEHTAEEVFCVCEPSDVQPASRRMRDRIIRRHRLFILNCGGRL